MKNLQKRIRSTVSGSLLMSLTSLALAPGLVLDHLRAGPTSVTPDLTPAATALAPPQFRVEYELAHQPLAPEPADFRSSTLAETEAADQVSAFFATEPEARTFGSNRFNTYFNTHSAFATPLVGGYAYKTPVVATAGSDALIAAFTTDATEAAVKQTFTPRNNKPARVVENDGIGSEPEPLPPGATPDDAGSEPTALANTNLTRLPQASVPEPSALALLGAGIVGLMLCRRQKA